MIPNEKKKQWLEKTGNPAALSLLESGISKNAEVATGSKLLYKEENKMNETETTEVTTTTTEPVGTPTETVVETVVTEEQPADTEILTVLEPLVKAIEVLNTRLDNLEKANLSKAAVTTSLLPSAAKTTALLKDRLSFLNAETFMIEADPALSKQKPAEETVKVKTEADTLFNGFLEGN